MNSNRTRFEKSSRNFIRYKTKVINGYYCSVSGKLRKEVLSARNLELSFVVPVFNRPSAIQRLLQSMTKQNSNEFEVVIVEDGSSDSCKTVVEEFRSKLNVKYVVNSSSTGPAVARNIGVDQSTGNFLLFVDSDCFLPPNYLDAVISVLTHYEPDAFGGPDTGHSSFSVLQKAIDYSMTAILTTGGIRGGREMLDLFYPKGFNMGIKRNVFETLGGFEDMRYGEDTELSYRIRKQGYTVRFIQDAVVYHQRRNDIQGFFFQVLNSGRARIAIYRLHPEALKVLHILPALALIIGFLLLVISVWFKMAILPIMFYALAVFLHASFIFKNPLIGLVSVCTSFVQVSGYGAGFLVQLSENIASLTRK